MPAQRIIHASDFHHWTQNANFDARLDRAFEYYRANVPGFDAQLQAQLDKDVWLMPNPLDNKLLDPTTTGGSNEDMRGQDFFGSYTGSVNGNIETHPTVALNLDTALVVTDPYGHITGVESAGSAAVHEIISHGSQGEANDLLATVVETGYNFFNERVAIGIDDVMNKLTGEPSRGNHGGTEFNTLDVTLHTVTNADGTMQLARWGSDGHMEYGPVIDLYSPGWLDIQKAYDELDILKGHAAAHDKSGIETVWTDDAPGFSVTMSGSIDPGGDSGRDASGQSWGDGGPTDGEGDNSDAPGEDTSTGAGDLGPEDGRNRDVTQESLTRPPSLDGDSADGANSGALWLHHYFNHGPHQPGLPLHAPAPILLHDAVPLVGVAHIDGAIF